MYTHCINRDFETHTRARKREGKKKEKEKKSYASPPSARDGDDVPTERLLMRSDTLYSAPPVFARVYMHYLHTLSGNSQHIAISNIQVRGGRL